MLRNLDKNRFFKKQYFARDRHFVLCGEETSKFVRDSIKKRQKYVLSDVDHGVNIGPSPPIIYIKHDREMTNLKKIVWVSLR